MKPRLSVIMPVWNGEKYIVEAMASVRGSFESLELIIVDDGSTDQTLSRVQASGIPHLHIRQSNAGPAAARNRGLKEARGEFVGFLDADDLWTGTHPARAVDYLQTHPTVDLVLGQVQCLTDAGGRSAVFTPLAKPFHTYQMGAAISRRELFERVGAFNPGMRLGEDVDWFLRAREAGVVIASLPEPALFYRLHSGNQPHIYLNSRSGLLEAFHHALQRRRDSLGHPVPAVARPLVSVIIPVRNGESFIAEAIESVFAQDYRPLELIVVDDGSTDNTRVIVQRFPLATLKVQAPAGAGVARNVGVRAATGGLLAFLDADDLWTPDKLSRQAELLMANPELEAVFAHVQEFGPGARPNNSGARPGPMPGTMLIRRSAFARVGWFDEDPVSLECVDWYLRASEKLLRARTLPEMLYRRRIHGKNRGLVARDHQGYVRAIKASLDRRRRTVPHPTAHAERS